MKWFVWVGDLGGGAKRYVDPATMEPIPLDPGSLARCTGKLSTAFPRHRSGSTRCKCKGQEAASRSDCTAAAAAGIILSRNVCAAKRSKHGATGINPWPFFALVT